MKITVKKKVFVLDEDKLLDALEFALNHIKSDDYYNDMDSKELSKVNYLELFKKDIEDGMKPTLKWTALD